MSQVIVSKKQQSLTWFVVIGALIFIVALAIAGWSLFSRYQHSRDWTPVTAEVTWAGPMCQMQYKSGKSWNGSDVVVCGEADAYIAAHPGENWRSVESDYVSLGYDAAAGHQDLLVRSDKVAVAPLAPDDRVGIFVDPSDPQAIDRTVSSGDYLTAAMIAGFGLIAMVVTILLGKTILGANAKIAARKHAT